MFTFCHWHIKLRSSAQRAFCALMMEREVYIVVRINRESKREHSLCKFLSLSVNSYTLSPSSSAEAPAAAAAVPHQTKIRKSRDWRKLLPPPPPTTCAEAVVEEQGHTYIYSSSSLMWLRGPLLLRALRAGGPTCTTISFFFFVYTTHSYVSVCCVCVLASASLCYCLVRQFYHHSLGRATYRDEKKRRII